MTMRTINIVLLCLFVFFSTTTESARILCYFAFPSFSHQQVFRGLWGALAAKGHQVTVVTPNPLNDSTLKNVREIDVSSTYKVVKETPLLSAFTVDNWNFEKEWRIFKLTTKVLEHQFNIPEVKQLLAGTSEKFDVILVHTFYMPALYGLSHRFKAPIIGVITFGMPLQGHDSVGNPSHPVLHPDLLLGYGGKPNFLERYFSTLYSVVYRTYYHYYVLPTLTEFARKYFGNDMPYLGDLEKNVSMQFMTVNPIVYSPRPNVPAVIELRQMHLNPPKPLDKDLKQELDNAKEGVIYFSLGSNVKSGNVDERLTRVIVDTVRELSPYKVLWKWETDVSDKPANAIVRKWLPQQDVLAHPNVKAFVTQGGLQSIEEAIDREVPLVVIPFLGDQGMNSVKLTEAGIAIGVDKNTVTKEELKTAVMEVAANPKYRQKIKEAKMILDDDPMTSAEKAVWWTEYVIRHKGARHLRSPALDSPLHQYFLLDVIGATLVGLAIIIFTINKTLSLLCSIAFKKTTKVKAS